MRATVEYISSDQLISRLQVSWAMLSSNDVRALEAMFAVYKSLVDKERGTFGIHASIGHASDYMQD